MAFPLVPPRSLVVRDPPRIETCASAPRLCLEQGVHPPLKPSRKHVEGSRRGFGPALGSATPATADDCRHQSPRLHLGLRLPLGLNGHPLQRSPVVIDR